MWWLVTAVLRVLVLIVPGIGLWGAESQLRAEIRGSAHDFSDASWSGGELCEVCHAPHGSDIGDTELLWNHEMTEVTFTLYNSASSEQTPYQPEGVSKLCLSCHDGVTAIDSFGQLQGTEVIGQNYPYADLGASLLDDHPIMVLMNSVATAPHLYKSPKSDAVKLYGPDKNVVGCGSCHDVHNGAGVPGLLRISNSGSALCLACHRI